LLETGLAPASSHALGWGPVQISTMFGVNAIFIFMVILVTFKLASMGITDTSLLLTGLLASIAGYLLMYIWWTWQANLWHFVSPVVLSTIAFPFMAGPTRSLFTKSVAANKHLCGHQGTLQAILSMSASVAGFAAPGLIAAFVLRTPEEVESSTDHRELTPYALFAPILSLLILLGVVYLHLNPPVIVDEIDQDLSVGERTSLISPIDLITPTQFQPTTEAHRRHSVAIMGISQISFHEPRTKTVGRQSVF
jgi:hypothetical protein